MSNIIFFGTPDYVLPIPQKLKDSGHNIVGVVTSEPKPVGRHQTVTPSPVDVWAKENNVPVFYKANTEDLKKLNPDLGVVAAYGAILPSEIVNLTPLGLLNVHPSLLPLYRGSCPIQAAILDGQETLGISIMKIDEKMDHGPLLYQEEMPIMLGDTFESLCQKSFERSSEILVEELPKYIKGEIKLTSQDDTQATYTWKISETKEKAYFDITNPPTPEILERMSRAFFPWPNAWTKWSFGTAQDFQNKIVKLYPNKVLQMEGKNPVAYDEFLRGYPDFPKILS